MMVKLSVVDVLSTRYRPCWPPSALHAALLLKETGSLASVVRKIHVLPCSWKGRASVPGVRHCIVRHWEGACMWVARQYKQQGGVCVPRRAIRIARVPSAQFIPHALSNSAPRTSWKELFFLNFTKLIFFLLCKHKPTNELKSRAAPRDGSAPEQFISLFSRSAAHT